MSRPAECLNDAPADNILFLGQKVYDSKSFFKKMSCLLKNPDSRSKLTLNFDSISKIHYGKVLKGRRDPGGPSFFQMAKRIYIKKQGSGSNFNGLFRSL